MMQPVSAPEQFLSFMLEEQIFGVPILQVSDVLGPQTITRIPLAPPAVAGAMNLRGRIVTVIDMRACLGRPPRDADQPHMGIVIDLNGELFSLLIDRVGDVLSLAPDTFEHIPATLDPHWRLVATGVHKLEKEILIVLDVDSLLRIAGEQIRDMSAA